MSDMDSDGQIRVHSRTSECGFERLSMAVILEAWRIFRLRFITHISHHHLEGHPVPLLRSTGTSVALIARADLSFSFLSISDLRSDPRDPERGRSGHAWSEWIWETQTTILGERGREDDTERRFREARILGGHVRRLETRETLGRATALKGDAITMDARREIRDRCSRPLFLRRS